MSSPAFERRVAYGPAPERRVYNGPDPQWAAVPTAQFDPTQGMQPCGTILDATEHVMKHVISSFLPRADRNALGQVNKSIHKDVAFSTQWDAKYREAGQEIFHELTRYTDDKDNRAHMHRMFGPHNGLVLIGYLCRNPIEKDRFVASFIRWTAALTFNSELYLNLYDPSYRLSPPHSTASFDNYNHYLTMFLPRPGHVMGEMLPPLYDFWAMTAMNEWIRSAFWTNDTAVECIKRGYATQVQVVLAMSLTARHHQTDDPKYTNLFRWFTTIGGSNSYGLESRIDGIEALMNLEPDLWTERILKRLSESFIFEDEHPNSPPGVYNTVRDQLICLAMMKKLTPDRKWSLDEMDRVRESNAFPLKEFISAADRTIKHLRECSTWVMEFDYKFERAVLYKVDFPPIMYAFSTAFRAWEATQKRHAEDDGNAASSKKIKGLD